MAPTNVTLTHHCVVSQEPEKPPPLLSSLFGSPNSAPTPPNLTVSQAAWTTCRRRTKTMCTARCSRWAAAGHAVVCKGLHMNKQAARHCPCTWCRNTPLTFPLCPLRRVDSSWQRALAAGTPPLSEIGCTDAAGLTIIITGPTRCAGGLDHSTAQGKQGAQTLARCSCQGARAPPDAA